MSTPEIRIKDAWLLRENASVHLNELWGKGEPLGPDEWYVARTKSYEEAWKPYDSKILEGMQDVLELEFRQTIIDVYIAPWFHAFSDPLVIGVMNDPDTFIDVLTHELLHRLLTDNTTIDFQTGDLGKAWPKLFGEAHSFKTLVHIPVHAVHKALYLDVLHEPERLKRELDNYKHEKAYDPNDYIKAWEYVDTHGYKEIIEQLKQSYKIIAAKQAGN